MISHAAQLPPPPPLQPPPPSAGLPFVYHYVHQSHHDFEQRHLHGVPPHAVRVGPGVVQLSPRPALYQSRPSMHGNWPEHGVVWSPQTPIASAQMTSHQAVAPISPQHGPPRRPVQSKYALWVGNIPGHAHILALRDHFFAPEHAHEILSVVFTPSSNSGFINFRSDEACKASMRRFNKSFFYGVPLNCRARKSTISSPPALSTKPRQASDASASPTLLGSPISVSASLAPKVNQSQDLGEGDSAVDGRADQSPSNEVDGATDGGVLDKLSSLSLQSSQGSNRYFIIKSLTLDDLVNSVKSRRWSTQTHNEHVLDEAFKNGDYVYLIFSVNRSREYFGYARMTTAANYDPAPVVTSTPQIHNVHAPTQASKPPIIRTAPLGHIPAGRIVDEMCRGKVFWEVEGAEQSAAEQQQPGGAIAVSSSSTTTSSYGSQKSFGIEWLSLTRVPFRQTTHLRNALNENKEVKVARDGTELDAEVGRRLCSLFHLPN